MNLTFIDFIAIWEQIKLKFKIKWFLWFMNPQKPLERRRYLTVGSVTTWNPKKSCIWEEFVSGSEQYI